MTRFSFFQNQIDFDSCVITIGNFDGCHLGHRELIEITGRLGKTLGVPSVSLTFDPHPQEYFRPSPSTVDLLTTEQKMRAFLELGITHPFVLRFNDELFHTSHEDFYAKFLRDTLRAKAITVGENFYFGFHRLGNVRWLSKQGEADGLIVNIVPPVLFQDQPISSTRIRELLLSTGDVETAAQMLGHTYFIAGTITHGDKMGRTLQFPTANLSSIDQLVPKEGVYCGYVWLENMSKAPAFPLFMSGKDSLFPAVFSIGHRPTFQKKEADIRVEAHLLQRYSPEQTFYNLKACYYLKHRLRDNVAFSGPDELKMQIARDVAQAKKLL
ncbi:MAG: riboflavin biosynthesis protein RibF [Deltaproteobacteria bacterium]|nr:riboflavin biosynthesis protein RibF [Deltaproteobacteria bacterium]